MLRTLRSSADAQYMHIFPLMLSLLKPAVETLLCLELIQRHDKQVSVCCYYALWAISLLACNHVAWAVLMYECLMQNSVNKKKVEDYSKFIQPEDEMWLKKISGKLTKSGYTSHKQFQADVHQLMTNAQIYNGAGGGVCAYPGKQSHFGCLLIAALHMKVSCCENWKGCLMLSQLHRCRCFLLR